MKKLNTYWKLAYIISFFLYYLGVILLYNFFRKNISQKHRRIILTYHRINNLPINPEMTVYPNCFQKQMSYLSSKYEVVKLEDILSEANYKSKPRDLAAITFDDGYADNFDFAFPVLKSRKLPATIFLISDWIGKKEKDMLTINQIKEMQKYQISFGSHTCSHQVLSNISLREQENEIANSKEILEKILDKEIFYFAFPKGKKNHYNKSSKEILTKYRYKYALTMENGDIGQSTDLMEIPRIGIRNVPMFVFKTRISGIFESSFFFFFREILKVT